MKILIFGDSFAADWTVKYPEQKGWPNLLAEKFQVKNIAQAGVSEYKIYQQIMSVSDIDSYDFFIVSHTSPYRAVTRQHPIHYNDPLHKNADLILADIDYHAYTIKGFFNRSLRAAQSYIKHHYDIEYQEVTYNLFRNTINRLLPADKLIVISNFPNEIQFDREKNFLDLSKIQIDYPGLINHVSDIGNEKILKMLLDKIHELT
jgi:hypothetical protein